VFAWSPYNHVLEGHSCTQTSGWPCRAQLGLCTIHVWESVSHHRERVARHVRTGQMNYDPMHMTFRGTPG
jgi:hypothetical protein